MSQLFKQKYFCQICNRQCQDKDGFNCHMNSNTHRLNMERVSKNPELYITNYSLQFEKDFLDILNRSSQQSFVGANKIYQEYITDKASIHLNATKWSTLTAFINDMENKGKIETKIQNQKEIFIRIIDLDPNKKLSDEKKIRFQKTEEIKLKKEFKKFKDISVRNELKSNKNTQNDDDLNSRENKINDPAESKELFQVSFKNEKKQSLANLKEFSNKPNFLNKKRANNNFDFSIKNSNKYNDLSLTENFNNSLNKDTKFYHVKRNECDFLNEPWISENLIVRIKDKNLEFYNYLSKIISLKNEFLAEVKILDSDKKITILIDQVHIEPVFRKNYHYAKILFGEKKNEICEFFEKKDNYATLKLEDGSMIDIELEYICSYEL